MLRRIFGVTGGLIVVGAFAGALAGLIALIPIPIQHALRPTIDDGFVSFGDLAPYALAFGAMLGAVLGPMLAWSMLRHVPLWRVVVHPLVGTVIGTALGWIVGWNPWLPGIPAILGGALVGMIGGGIQLSVRVRRALKAGQPESAA